LGAAQIRPAIRDQRSRGVSGLRITHFYDTHFCEIHRAEAPL
jgi:hypothetical protein